jgi:hypothetical protein
VKRTLSILTLIMMASALTFAQQAPPQPPTPPTAQKVTPKTPYDSTKAQLLSERQKNLQLQAGNMNAGYQQQMKDLQSKFGELDKQLNDWVAEVRKANDWDDTYTYDRESDSWSHTPKPEPPKAPEKK